MSLCVINITEKNANTGRAIKAYPVGIPKTVKSILIFIIPVFHPEKIRLIKKTIIMKVRTISNTFLTFWGNLSIIISIVK